MTNTPFSILSFAMLEQFREFLDKQEAALADSLLLATIPAIDSKVQTPLHLHGSGHFRLAQSLQVMTTRIRNLHEGKTTQEEWSSAVTIINKAFWSYVEVLEGAVQELFSHMDKVDLNGWSEDYYNVVTSFKELLAHRIEDLLWVFKRVEDLMIAYKLICKRQKNIWMIFGKLLSRFSHALDKTILENLAKSDEVLAIRHKSFDVSYNALRVLIPEIQEKESRFASFPVFITLEKEQRDLIIKLYRLIALNDKNAKLKTLNQQLLVDTMNNVAKAGSVCSHFRHYLALIRKKLFEYCLTWQNEHDPVIQKPIHALEKELDFVKNMIGSYREMLARSESRPYGQTRWPLTEWIVGKEPRKTRDLLHLLYQIDSLKKLFPAIDLAVERKGLQEGYLLKRNRLKKQMDDVLHEMGQPLSSRSLIQVKADRLIELIDLTDELGGSLGDVRGMITEVLLKAMHFDAKYQVLNDYPRFHEIYAIHEGLMEPLNDPEHIKRTKLFQSVIQHVEHWVRKHEVEQHAPELEVDEAAINESLQEILGAIQRDNLSAEDKQQYDQMLLAYRYQFSQFFHYLRSFETEGKAIRSQFAFVDHYLDAIEAKLKQGHAVSS